jgi:cytochrome c oxidase subunit IV
MEHILHHKDEQSGANNEIKKVTIILSVLTLVELALGFWMYKSFPDVGFARNFIKGVIIILMLAKAYYIVSYFMHLGHELRNLIMTIVVPLALFVWFIIAFLYDGHSFNVNRNTYDRYKNERGQPNQANPNAPSEEHKEQKRKSVE